MPRHPAAPLLLLASLVAATLLGAPSPAGAQPLPGPRFLSPDELPGVTTEASLRAMPGGADRSILPLKITPRSSPYLTPIGDPSLRTFAVFVNAPPAPPPKPEPTDDLFAKPPTPTPGPPSLIAPLYMLRDAERIEIDGSEVQILRADPDLGLAVLSLPDHLSGDRLPRPANLLPEDAHVERIVAIVADAEGRPGPRPAELGDPGEEALAFYRRASRGLPPGTPLLDPAGHLVALVALITPADHYAWAIDARAIARFLASPDPEAPKQ
jgi:hypothetical protein